MYTHSYEPFFIKPLSTLNTLYVARNQTVQLPDAIRGFPT